MTTNLALAKALADFADALADYNHLPPLASVGLNMTPGRPVILHPDANDRVDSNVRAIAVWAATFRQDVTITLPGEGRRLVDITTGVEIGGRAAVVTIAVLLSEYRAVEKRYGLGHVADGDEIKVPGADLVAAFDSKAVA